MSTTYPESTRKESFGKAPIKKVELSTSTQTDPALTDKTRTKRSNLILEGSGKNSQAAGANKVIAAITSEMTRVDVRRGEQWRWMVAIMMSNGPVVVAETAFTLSRGTPWEWVCIKQKKSSDYEERPRLQRSVDRR